MQKHRVVSPATDQQHHFKANSVSKIHPNPTPREESNSQSMFSTLSSYPSNSPQRKHEHRILRLLSGLECAGWSPGTPSFSHALRINCDRLKCKQFVHLSDDNRSITFRYKVSPQLAIPRSMSSHSLQQQEQQQNNRVSLCTYLAIIDEVTTWALMILENTRRPGISACLQGEWGPAASSVNLGDTVDIVATITNIADDGRVGYINAAILTVDNSNDNATISSNSNNAQLGRNNNNVVCYATHVKHLKSGGKLPSRESILTRLCSCDIFGNTGVKEPQTYDLREVFSTLEPSIIENGTTATFVAASYHSHYYQNGGGTQEKNKSKQNYLHNGCQSILMELVGMQEAKNVLLSDFVELESIYITFQRSPSSPIVDIVTELLTYDDTFVSMRVLIRRGNESQKSSPPTIVSEGLLRWKLIERHHHYHHHQRLQQRLRSSASPSGNIVESTGNSPPPTITSDDSDFSSTAYPASVVQQTHHKHIENDRRHQHQQQRRNFCDATTNFLVDDHVTIRNLVHSSHLNGQCGIVKKELDHVTGRYVVVIGQEAIKIKSDNLVVATNDDDARQRKQQEQQRQHNRQSSSTSEPNGSVLTQKTKNSTIDSSPKQQQRQREDKQPRQEKQPITDTSRKTNYANVAKNSQRMIVNETTRKATETSLLQTDDMSEHSSDISVGAFFKDGSNHSRRRVMNKNVLPALPELHQETSQPRGNHIESDSTNYSSVNAVIAGTETSTTPWSINSKASWSSTAAYAPRENTAEHVSASNNNGNRLSTGVASSVANLVRDGPGALTSWTNSENAGTYKAVNWPRSLIKQQQPGARRQRTPSRRWVDDGVDSIVSPSSPTKHEYLTMGTTVYPNQRRQQQQPQQHQQQQQNPHLSIKYSVGTIDSVQEGEDHRSLPKNNSERRRRPAGNSNEIKSSQNRSRRPRQLQLGFDPQLGETSPTSSVPAELLSDTLAKYEIDSLGRVLSK